MILYFSVERQNENARSAMESKINVKESIKYV